MDSFLNRALRAGRAAFALCWAIPLAITFAPAAANAALSVQPVQPGNIFLTGDLVEVPVAMNGDSVVWIARDFYGRIAAQGTASPVGGVARIRPAVSLIGYFSLELSERAGGTVISSVKTSFAILEPIPEALLSGSPFGVQTHFAQGNNTLLLSLMKKAGITRFRDEHYWSHVEPSRGTFFVPPQFQSFMNQAASQSLQPLMILDWANPYYDYQNGVYTAPHTDFGRAGFANYARNLLIRYGSQLQEVEVWNEFNGGSFVNGPATANRPLYYYRLLKTVYESIKPSRPDVTVVAGATIPVAHGFLRDLFAQGAMPFLDAVSIHPYGKDPEAVELEIASLRTLIQNANGGVAKPIWATEFSMDAKTESDRANSASYLVRMLVCMLNVGVERMYYYLMQDDDSFPYRGLVGKVDPVKGSFLPTPAYAAYANAIRQLADWEAAGRVEDLASTTYAYQFTKAGASSYVAWATTPTTLQVTASGPVTVFDLMGNPVATATGGSISLANVGVDPVFIEGNVTGLAEVDNPIVADSVAGYSSQQGYLGWSYGYALIPAGGAYRTDSFRPMTWDIWKQDNYRWVGNSEYHYIASSIVHPGNDPAVRRWTSTVTGTVKLAGTIARGPGGDGVGVAIYVNGTPRLNLLLNPGQTQAYEVTNVNVVPGTMIDFLINRRGENSFDSTDFTSRITLSNGSTPPTEASPLAAPEGLTARGGGFNAVELSWIDRSSGEESFLVERKWGAEPYYLAAQLPANTVYHIHRENMPPGRVYTFRVRGTSGGQYSLYSNEASSASGVPTSTPPPTPTPTPPPASTPTPTPAPTPTPTPTPTPPPTPPPTPTPTPTPTPPPTALTAPTSLLAVGIADNVIGLTWSDNATGEQGYRVEEKWGGQSYYQVAELGPNATSYTRRENLPANRVYTYRVRAFSGSQVSGYSNESSTTDRP